MLAPANMENVSVERSDDALLTKPIVIVGAGRSGMSFLAELLERYGSLAVIEEPRLIWKYGNDHKSDMLHPEDARPEVIADIRSTFAMLIRKQGKQRLVDVTPGTSLRLGFVNRVFPDCRFVHLIRDGVDNVLGMRRFYAVTARRIILYGGYKGPRSLRKIRLMERLREARLRQVPYYAMEVVRRVIPEPLLPLVGPPVVGARLPGMVAMRREMDLLEVCFWQWRACVELACHYGRRLPVDRYMECRIEDLSPEVVKSVLAFCELDDNPAVLEYLEKRLDSKRLRAPKQDADPEELARLKQWVEPTMQWLSSPVSPGT